ncbi:MAG: diacylglycerol kinase [Gammaproteobacteria bacterium]|nr:diacylglycerol kinase [Gammaproteobacteria bacterium]
MKEKHELGNGVGLWRALRALRCSWLGLAAAFKFESAFRQELALATLFLPYALWVGANPSEKMLLVILVILVLVVELLNSAIEAVVDRVGLEQHELSGRAKDLGSAAVMLSLVSAGGCFAYVSYLRFSG